ncbi:MAG: adenine phosphoribosyltransferase [Flavobacteriales bacterium]|nr:adenine phosphoribosyltransferase [Flavobacteriales bacterium]
MNSIEQRIKSTIRDVKDFPKPGILFKDIMPVLEDPMLSADIVDYLADLFAEKKIDAIIGVESRGFLFGMALAIKMKVPFVSVRKKGKLPYKTISYKYDLEYGSAEVEMHVDSIKPNWNVLIHDDLLATGGTASAAAELVKMQGGNVAGFAFIVELEFLKGRERLQGYSPSIINIVAY